HFQRDAINLEEMQQVLGSLPSKVGNDIARTALPIVTQARQEELASQLVANLPNSRKPTKISDFATQQAREADPIPNRKSAHETDGAPSTIHDQRSTTNDAPPIPNRKSAHENGGARSTIHDQRSTTNETPPIPTGKTKPKKIKPEWIRQTARRIEKNRP